MALATCSAWQSGAITWPTGWGASGRYKIISDREFVFGGKVYPAGRISDPIDQNWCALGTISVSSSVPTFSAFTLPQTDTGITVVNESGEPTFTLVYYSAGNTKRGQLFSNWRIGASLGASFNFETLAIYNASISVINPRTDFLGTNAILNLINAVAYAPATTTQLGLVEMATTPADSAHPRVPGDNDPRINLVITASSYVTSGSGTTGSPYLGWDTTVPWADNLTVEFQTGKVYGFSTTLTLTYSNLKIITNGARFKFTGTGDPIYINGSAQVNGARNIVIDQLLIDGNASATNGLHLRKVVNSVFGVVRATNISNVGVLVEHGVSNVFIKPAVSVNDASFTTTPKYGLYFDWNPAIGAGTNSTNNTIIDPVMEGITTSPGVGIYADHCDQLKLIGGTSEANTIGYQGTANSSRTNIDGMFFEMNATADVLDAGFAGRYTGIQSDGLVHFSTTAYTAQVNGGFLKNVTIDAGATSINLDGPAIGTGGTVTDNGTHTRGGYYDVATASWSAFRSPTLHVYGADGTGNKTVLEFDHPGSFNSGDEAQANWTQMSLVLGRDALAFAGGGLFSRKFYTGSGSALNSIPALELTGTNNAVFVGNVTTGKFQNFSGPGSVLTISSNTITPTNQVHHVGAGLIKTITVPSGFATGVLYLIPDAAFTYDATGNIGLAGTATIGRMLVFTWDGTRWYPSY